MKEVKFTPTATIAIQMVAHTEVTALMHKGTLYVPMLPDLGLSVSDSAYLEETKPTRVVKETTETTPTREVTKPSSSSKKYTEEELMAMETKELEKICKTEDIEIPEEGKNTNKKLRLLILDHQESVGVEVKVGKAKKEVEEEEDEPIKPAAKKGKKASSGIAEIFSSLDATDIEEDEAIEKLVELGITKKLATKKVTAFMEDASLDIEEIVAELEESLDGADAPAEKPEPKAKGKKETPVEIEDLEIGDKVKVYWEDEEDYFTGEVTAINRKGVSVTYDSDGQACVLDSKVNTEIFLIS